MPTNTKFIPDTLLIDGETETPVMFLEEEGSSAIVFKGQDMPAESIVFYEKQIKRIGKFKRVYILRPTEVGNIFYPNQKVILNFSAEELVRMRDSRPMGLFVGSRDIPWFQRIEKEIFTIPGGPVQFAGQTDPKSDSLQSVEKTATGCEPIPYYSFHSQKLGETINIPATWLRLATEEEVTLAGLSREIHSLAIQFRDVEASTLSAKRDAYRMAAGAYQLAYDRLIIKQEGMNKWIVDQLKPADESVLLTIKKDPRVIDAYFVRDDRGECLHIITNMIEVDFQTSRKVTMPYPPMRLELRTGSPYSFFITANNRLDYHPHHVSGSSICVGNYSGAYQRARTKKDWLTCFEIAIEVLCNANMDNLGHKLYECLGGLIFSYDDYEDMEDGDDSAWDKFEQVTKQLRDGVKMDTEIFRANYRPPKSQASIYTPEMIEKAIKLFL